MTPFVDNLAGIADCARLLVRLCVLDPSRFHRHMAEEVHLSLLEPAPSRSGEVISALFRPTGEFDLEVEHWESVDGQHRVTVYFDGFRVAWCNSRVVPTGATVGAVGNPTNMSGPPAWTVDQDEAALWASGAGAAHNDEASTILQIEAAAVVALAQLTELLRYAQSEQGAG